MRTRKELLGLMLVLSLLLAACGAATPAPAATATAEAMMHDEAMATPTPDTMMPEEMTATVTPDEMMPDDMGTPAPDPMMREEMTATVTPEVMMPDDMGTPTADPMMHEEVTATVTPGAMMHAPAWFGAELMDVNTGRPFSVSGLQGKVVLVEAMAIWCPKCLEQQKQVQALRAALGARDDVAIVVLDVDPNEDASSLKAYAAGHRFDWTYAVAPRDVARELGQLYGDQFLNPTATPMLIVDRRGEAHVLPFGIKSAAELQTALEPFLGETQ